MESTIYKDYGQIMRAIRTKPFVLLTGASGTGKTRLVRELAYMSCTEELQDKDGTEPGNLCVIEVSPDWRDSRGVLGLSGDMSKFVITPFVRFLIKAKTYPNVPFFVCLDDMNFAQPELYLAELLYVIDTRKYVKSANAVKTATLIDGQYFKKFFRMNALCREGLSLPDNVIIVGTVNLDEAGYKFSRKVIDRAMTIEMNGGRVCDIFGKSKRLRYRDEKDVVGLEMFKSKYVTADDVVERCVRMRPFRHLVTGDENNPDTLSALLKQIGECLDDTPYRVSLRVMNDLVVYLAVLLEDERSADVTEARFKQLMKTAVDDIFRMKILPRYYIHRKEPEKTDKASTKTYSDKISEPAAPYGFRSGDCKGTSLHCSTPDEHKGALLYSGIKNDGTSGDEVLLIGYTRNPLMVRIKRKYHIRANVSGKVYGMSPEYNKARYLLLHDTHGERALYAILGNPRTVFGSEIASLGLNPNAFPTDQYLLYDIGEEVEIEGFDIQRVKFGEGVAFALPHFRTLSNPNV